MPKMLHLAAYFSCGATACYLLGRGIKRKVDCFKSITPVVELNMLDDLLKEKTDLLVVVSGRVGSAVPFHCKDNGILAVFAVEKANVDFHIKFEDDGLVKKSLNFLLQQKESPWYLEDSTGQVNIVEAQSALGFNDTLNKYVLAIPANELFDKLVKPEGFKVLDHRCHECALTIGTYLTFVGEASRDQVGNLMIQRPPKEQSFLVFRGEGSFDKMVDDMKANSETYFFYSKIFGTIALAIAIMYGVNLLRRVLLPFEWEKNDLRNRPEKDISGSTETDQGEKSDTSHS